MWIITPLTVWNLQQKPFVDREKEWLEIMKLNSGKGKEETYKEGSGVLVEHLQSAYPSFTFPYCFTMNIFPWILAESLILFTFPWKGKILDLFAGGYVRHIVAGLMGCVYHGCEIRRSKQTST